MIELKSLIAEYKTLDESDSITTEGFWDNLKSKLGVGTPTAPAAVPASAPRNIDAEIDAQFAELNKAGILDPAQRLTQFRILNPQLYLLYIKYYPNGKMGDGTHDTPTATPTAAPTGSVSTGSIDSESFTKIENVAKKELLAFQVTEHDIEGTKISGAKRTVMYNIKNFSSVNGRIQTYIFNMAQVPSYIGNVALVNSIYDTNFKPELHEGEYSKETLVSEYIDIIGGVIADLTEADVKNYNVNKLAPDQYKQSILQYLHNSEIINTTANTVIQTHINFINKFKTLSDVSPEFQKEFNKNFSIVITNGRTLTNPSTKEEPKKPEEPKVSATVGTTTSSSGGGSAASSPTIVYPKTAEEEPKKQEKEPKSAGKSKQINKKEVVPKKVVPKKAATKKIVPKIVPKKTNIRKEEGINEEYRDYTKYFV